MTAPIVDRTHAASARAWLASANEEGSDFPIQNLPFGVFRRRGSDEDFRGGVAIGDQVLDLDALVSAVPVDGEVGEALDAAAGPSLDPLLALGRQSWGALRVALFDMLSEDASKDVQAAVASCLVPMADVENAVPTSVGDYTDFYTSLDHAVNASRLFGLDKPTPNFYSMPIAYHGRSSTIGVSGQKVPRPKGQTVRDGAVSYGPSARLDYEMELGVFVGPGSTRGARIPIHEAEDHLFGMCLLNDWSARDIQAFELNPLGPFNAKNFATTISPWIVTMEALAPFRRPFERLDGDREVPRVPYLHSEANDRAGAIDIKVSVSLEVEGTDTELSKTTFAYQYWTAAQMLTHHSSGGCGFRPGDMLGTGTISGPTNGEAGAMIELANGGQRPVTLVNGEQRSFLQDGDQVVMRGWSEAEGFRRIGFGECRGTVLPAIDD